MRFSLRCHHPRLLLLGDQEQVVRHPVAFGVEDTGPFPPLLKEMDEVQTQRAEQKSYAFLFLIPSHPSHALSRDPGLHTMLSKRF